jgi:pimeloyl-[acyl-carrier protein] methyl ester esterase
MMDLVLIPGWGFDRRVWQPLAGRLAAQFRLHFDIDIPPPGAVVCGWSLGALRALQWAEHYPDRVARVVLVGATPRFVRADDWTIAQPAALLDNFAAGVAADPAAALRRFVALINQGDDRARSLTRQMQALVAEHRPDAAALAAGLAQLRAVDLRAAASTIAQPTLVLHGERDPLMPLAAGRWLAERLPAGRLVTFAGAAHAPFLSQPERFAAVLADFAHE